MRHIFYDSLKKILFAFVAMMFVAPAFSATKLPIGYTQLEYLESDGGQYIDTLVSGFNTGDWNIYAKFMTTNTTQTSYATVFNAYSSENHNSYRVLLQSGTNGAYYVSANSKAGGGSVRVNEKPAGQIYEVTLRNNTFVFDDVTYDAPNNTGTTLPSDVTMKLFGRGASSLLWKGRIYSAWATKDGVMQYNLVPAKYVSGNTTTYGMYDLKNERFLTNSGTGTFTAGPIACPNGERVTYTTANGTTTWTGTPTPTTPITFVDYTQGELKLRAVGNWADSYDANTGKITRKIGTLILKGNEGFTVGTPLSSMFNLNGVTALSYPDDRRVYSTHFKTSTVLPNASTVDRNGYIERSSDGKIGIGYMPADGDVDTFKSWLAEQYAAGTPVIIYYPLPTETEEIWPAEQCIAGNLIKIATTKYTEDAFAGLMTTLSEAITKVTNIVDTTVQQATEIGNLATTKQDRPDTDCPAGRKCLLIMGADNKPHWYLIQE